MDAIDRFGETLVRAGQRRSRWTLRALPSAGGPYTPRPLRSLVRLHVALIALALLLATTAIALAATGVILTGSPVRTISQPIATAGEGIPVEGGSRLLPLRAVDPAGGLPWGMRIVHTTRGLVCLQVGRVYHGQLGQLGVDGAFADDGRFHALPPDALPDVVRGFEGFSFENCAAPGDTYAGDIVGLQTSAASNPRAGVGVTADRREISFGLLGEHAVSITYRSGPETHTQPVLPGLGAYLIVQRYTSGRQLGSVSETDGSDQRYPYGGPASPNGALTAITYRYAGKLCTDIGKGRIFRSCGLSEGPPPTPVALPVMHAPLRVHLQIHGRVLTAVKVAFRAPYSITSATQRYDVSVSAYGCHEIGGLLGTDRNLASGAAISISAPIFSPGACSRVLTIEVSYDSFLDNNIQHTTIGTATIREPPGTHPAPLPRRVVELERRSNPTRSLHAPIHLMLLPQPRAACNAAFLLYPCYKGEVGFTAPYAVTSAAAGYSRAAEYSVDGFATCKVGGRPETSWRIQHNVRAHETLTTTSLGLFVLTPSCASSEGFKVDYLTQQGPSASAPHESVVVGTVTLSKATLPNGQNSKPHAHASSSAA